MTPGCGGQCSSMVWLLAHRAVDAAGRGVEIVRWVGRDGGESHPSFYSISAKVFRKFYCQETKR